MACCGRCSDGALFRSAAVVTCLFVAASPVSGFDSSLGGVSEIRIAADLDRHAIHGGDKPDTWDYGNFVFNPSLVMSGGGTGSELAWEILASAECEGKTDPAGLSFRITSSHLRYWLGDSFSFRIGYFNDPAIAAGFFPLTLFFGSTDPLSLMESGGERKVRGFEPLIEVRYAIPVWRVSLMYAPFRPIIILPDTGSPWFPEREIPLSFVFAGQTYRRGELAYEIEDSGVFPRFEPSWKIGTGLSAGAFELDLVYFHGRDRRTLFTGRTDSMESAYTFDVLLVPSSASIDMLTLGVTGVFGDVRAYTEAAIGSGGLFATGSYEFSGIYIKKQNGKVSDVPPAVPAKETAATFGLDWRGSVAGFQISVVTEATWSLLLGSDSDGFEISQLELRDFSRVGAALVSFRDPRGKLELSATVMMSLLDFSAVFRPSLRFEISPDDELSIVAPFYFGNEDSELGRYSALRYLIAGIKHRF